MTKRKNQVVKFRTIAEKLPELEGKEIIEIAKILGYGNPNTARITLWKRKDEGKITFKVEDGTYTDFELLDGEMKTTIADDELSAKGLYLKSLDRYRVAMNEFDIALDTTAKPETRQKADTNILRAIDRIPNHLYALLYEQLEG